MNDDYYLYVSTWLIVIVGLLYFWSVSTYGYWRKFNVPYVKPVVPIFGNLLPFAAKKENYPQTIIRIYRLLDGHPYGGYFEMRDPILMIRDPDLIGAILVKDFDYFQDRKVELGWRPNTRRLNPVSTNLFTLKGDRWKSLRGRLTSVFTASKLNAMLPAMEKCAANIRRQISTELSLTSSTTDNDGYAESEVREKMINYIVDAISACALSVNFTSDRSFADLVKKTFSTNYALRALLIAVDERLLDIFRLPDFPKDVTDFFVGYVEEIMRHRRESGDDDNKCRDFLQTMMDIKNDRQLLTAAGSTSNENETTEDRYNDLDIVANTFVFFVGGYETTASALTFCLHELAFNTDVQDKLRAELKNVNHEDDRTFVESVKNLKYLDMIIAETVRKYPLMPTIFRLCTKDYLVPSTGYVIRKGTKLVIPNNAIQMDPTIHPNPDKFDPDRFLPEHKAKLRNGCYLPFGDGPRYCIGMRFAQLVMKIMLIEIISNFVLQPSSKTKYNIEYEKGAPLVAPENGLWINIKPIRK